MALLASYYLVHANLAFAEEKYKKKTFVNFEESLVEGKSRSPYSSYLFKKRENSIRNLSNWKPNWNASLSSTRKKLE